MRLKRPAFQFYPADWRKDAALQSCSMAAQGLWTNVLCIAHECEPYGHLRVNGRPMSPAQIARLVGLSAKECATLLDELFDAGVSSVDAEGGIFSRRMVRDEDLRNRRANGGCGGAEHGIKGAEHGAKGGRPAKARGDTKPPLEPPPSSSSSSSASAIHSEPNGSGGPPPTDNERVWAFGVPLLTAAGVKESNARSMLGGLCKSHGAAAVADAIQRCAQAGPVEPVSWLQAVLKTTTPTTGETAYQRAARERIEQVAPGIAAKPPGRQTSRQPETFDVATQTVD